MKTTTKTGENQNSVEKWEKKISKPFKPLVFSENFICDPLNVFYKPRGLECYLDIVYNIWIM